MHAKLNAVQLVASFVDSMQAYHDDYVELTIKRIHSHSICLCDQKNMDTIVPEPYIQTSLDPYHAETPSVIATCSQFIECSDTK